MEPSQRVVGGGLAGLARAEINLSLQLLLLCICVVNILSVVCITAKSCVWINSHIYVWITMLIVTAGLLTVTL